MIARVSRDSRKVANIESSRLVKISVPFLFLTNRNSSQSLLPLFAPVRSRLVRKLVQLWFAPSRIH
jgi:hypothetical protein